MIYDSVSEDASIQQGDIFRDLPRIDISLNSISVLNRNSVTAEIEPRETSWLDLLEEDNKEFRAILPVTPVKAIVITQSCDAVRADDISLCEITPLPIVFKDAVKKLDIWVKFITKEGTDHLRWFYLPQAASLDFNERKAVDFRTVLRIPRPHLETLKNLRIGRLNQVAYEHFREKLAQFFRRYPYNPWYPLNKEEFEQYASQYKGIPP